MLKFFALVASTVALSTAWASSPGAPIDCSDFVAVQPGYACVQLSNPSQLSCGGGAPGTPCGTGESHAIDNESRFVTISNEFLGHCGSFGANPYFRHKFMASTGSGLIEIGHIDDRCKPPTVYKDLTGVTGYTVEFDPMAGALYVWTNNQCECTQPFPPQVVGDCTTYCAGWPDPNNSRQSRWVMKIVGFATTFEVLQSYEPTTSEIQFRVPYAPEGFAEADYFDTYWGSLRPGIDFSQAQSLRCGYPNTQPLLGDFESVPDTLPSPQVGNGYYYLTVTRHSGEARAGRKGVHGHLEGRDTSVLPACSAQQ